MYTADKFKEKAPRSKPSQARGKERVRLILAAALDLYQEKGVEDVTTNDIAQRAKIPIGSLYRYYPNKDSIIAALTELYIEDISAIFREIGKHPMLKHLSWDEVLFLMVDGWVNYSRLNGPFAFLYAERANPKLMAQNKHAWERFIAAFYAVIKKRCPSVTERQLRVCFNLSLSAAELGINDEYQKVAGPNIHHDAVSAIASYMLRVCGSHEQHADGMLG